MTFVFWPLMVLIAAAVAYGVWRWRRQDPARGPIPTGLHAANTDRLRASARYRQLASRALRWSLVSLVSTLLVAVGSFLLVGRLADATTTKEAQHNRDIMLCLDVSGSMQEVDADMLRAFKEIIGHMRGERIGLTMWNNSSVLVFPLTDDYTYVTEQIDATIKALDDSDYKYFEGTSVGDGASLIGDGLASCIQRFDRLQEPRSRSIILATDNQLNGEPVYRLPQAIDLALRHRITVHGVADWESQSIREMRGELARTQGQMYLLDKPGDGAAIVNAIEATEARRLEGAVSPRVSDIPWPGVLLCSAGLLGLALAEPLRGLATRTRRRP